MQIEGFFIFAVVCVVFPQLVSLFLLWLIIKWLASLKIFKKKKKEKEVYIYNKFYDE